ncbi:MAG TPA: nucleoside-triphosphatase [Methanocorpusculum sp.]|nr:nucleoside-triphosphatase [Methanocorpusculum sp.]
MQRHIFLTGDIQVGKSTIIHKVIEELGIIVGGFRTIGGNYAKDGSSDVFLLGMNEEPAPDRIVAHRFGCGRGRTVYPGVFDTIGPRLLGDSSVPLIIMDELGFLENDAVQFQNTVMSALDGSVLVLGVIRNKQTPFLDKVRAHPRVDVIFVTEKNRDEVFWQVLSFVQKSYSR